MMLVPGTVVDQDLVVTLGTHRVGVVSDGGVYVQISEIKGWWNLAPATGELLQRSAGHGAWTTTAYNGPRRIELVVDMVGRDFDHVTPALDALLGAVPLNLGRFEVTKAGVAYQAMVRQDGETLTVRSGRTATISLSLLAPDPRRYSVNAVTLSTGLPQTTGGMSLPLVLPLSVGATTTAGVLSLTNDGNMATPWTATLTGPVPAGSAITHRGSGKTVRIPHEVAAGRTLTLDSDKRRALLDGTASRVVTGTSTWFDLDPGVNEIAFSAPSYNSGALLGVTYRSAWR